MVRLIAEKITAAGPAQKMFRKFDYLKQNKLSVRNFVTTMKQLFGLDVNKETVANIFELLNKDRAILSYPGFIKLYDVSNVFCQKASGVKKSSTVK